MFDFGLHGFGGSRVGRYGTAGLPDVSVHTDERFISLRACRVLSTLESTPQGPMSTSMASRVRLVVRRTHDPIQKKYVGYGSPFFNNTGCLTELDRGRAGFLPGARRRIAQATRV